MVRPIIIYAMELRGETKKTKQNMRTDSDPSIKIYLWNSAERQADEQVGMRKMYCGGCGKINESEKARVE